MSKKKSVIRAIQYAAIGGASTLAAAPHAYAQSSVTLYGVADVSILYTSRTLNSTTGAAAGHQFSMQSAGENASRFGLRGSEDLGGGLKANFQLESGINLANGGYANSNGELFGRQAWAGLSGGFGAITAGLQFSPFVMSMYAGDARDMKQFGSSLINYVDNVLVTGLFNSNSIVYASPDIHGLQGWAMYAFGGTAGNFRAGQEYSAALAYHVNGFFITAAMYNGNAGGSAATTPVPSTVGFDGRNIGASYNFGKVTVKAGYTLYKLTGSFDNRVLSGSLSYNVTPALTIDGGAWYTRDGNNANNHSILGSLGVDYALSKRTVLYSQVTFADNHGHEKTGLAINGATFGVVGAQLGADLGMRHSF